MAAGSESGRVPVASSGELRPSAPTLPSVPGGDAAPRARPSRGALTRSARAHTGSQSAVAVRRLAREVMPSLMRSGTVVPAASSVERILGPTVVQVEAVEGEQGGTVVSNWPVAVPPAAGASVPADGDAVETGAGASPDLGDAGWRLVDLGWTPAADQRLAVRRSAVPASLPKLAGGTVRVGGLRTRLAPVASTSVGVVSGESVTYPDVQRDTDLLVRSLPVGLQAGWQLRSPQAPTTLRVPLDLPDGQSAVVDGPTGEVVIRDREGDPVGSVSFGAAGDTAGERVPVRASVEGGELVVVVDHEEGVTQYPLIVAPVWNFHFDADWMSGRSGDFEGWRSIKSGPTAPFRFAQTTSPAGSWLANSGLSLFADPAVVPAGVWGAWARPAPGDQSVGTPGPYGRTVSAEHAYWTQALLGGVDFEHRNWQDRAAPVGRIAFVPPQNNWADWRVIPQEHSRRIGGTPSEDTFPGLWPLGGNQTDTYGTLRALANVPGNAFVTAIETGGPLSPPSSDTGSAPMATMNFSWFFLWAKDNVAPAVSIDPLPDWVAEDASIAVQTTDRGTGIASGQLGEGPGGGGAEYPGTWTSAASAAGRLCPVVGDMLCPFAVKFDFAVENLPEGRRPYEVLVSDAGERSTRQSLSVAVDRSAPTVTLAGDLFAQRKAPIGLAEEREVRIVAADGVPGGAASGQRSGVQRIDVFIDDALVSSTGQAQPGDSQGLTTAWTLRAQETDVGEHEVRIVAVDRVGHAKTTSFVVKKSRTDDADVPLPSLAGELADIEEEFAPIGRPTNLVSLGVDGPSGPDDGSGIRRVAVEIDGEAAFTRTLLCNDPYEPGCQLEVGEDGSVNFTSYNEGTHAIQVVATDDAGNTGRSDAWTVKVDKTPPAPATELEGYLDAATGVTQMNWLNDEDPALAGTSIPGSGTSKWTYRTRIAGGAWSAWVASTNPVVELDGLSLGTSIEAEVKSRDAVGNEVQSATLTTTVTTPPPAGEAVFRASDDPSSAQRAVPGGCGDSWSDVTRENLQGEPGISIEVEGRISCTRRARKPSRTTS